MYSYCTLFDSNYLSRGLAMYRSLVACGGPCTLYVACFDDDVLKILLELNLEGVVPIPLQQLESPELIKAKQTRTPVEYCWTCTPHLIRYVLDTYRPPLVTYLDADLYFYQDPSVLLDDLERSSGSVLLTEHRFSPQLVKDIKFGRFCVQFMSFKNDVRGRVPLDWWADRCLEWCHARLEDDKFGDQKYLDDWYERFAGVHISSHPGAGVANWNLQQYSLGGSTGSPLVDGVPIVFYHFHGVKLYENGKCDLGYKQLGRDAITLIYANYIRALHDIEDELKNIDPQFRGGKLKNRHPLAWLTSFFWRKPLGIYNVFSHLSKTV